MATAEGNDEYETESGIILEANDIENIIKAKITKIGEKNQ